ncbi:MAG: uL30 family ribosomal protein [Candidatus Marsarchaeota archaeon]|jgi:large subunit ribosomal protein L30|nr:uL30 family ribosomal protein [Candidatus Marsarchaeota archaeon]MCL5419980.1 uL30 family ribosomal protein [Candidatus Marsarchaeota archaeon]
MAAELNNKLLAVVRVRGTIGVRRDISETLSRLRLKRVNNMIFIFGTRSNLGMIKKCNDFITYGEVDQALVEKVLSKKLVKVGREDLLAMASGKKVVKDVVALPIRLHPPTHGYESTKRAYSVKGSLGYRGAAIGKLISRMS